MWWTDLRFRDEKFAEYEKALSLCKDRAHHTINRYISLGYGRVSKEEILKYVPLMKIGYIPGLSMCGVTDDGEDKKYMVFYRNSCAFDALNCDNSSAGSDQYYYEQTREP